MVLVLLNFYFLCVIFGSVEVFYSQICIFTDKHFNCNLKSKKKS